MTKHEYLWATLAMLFAGYACVMTLALCHQSDVNKSQQRAFICFDQQGRVTNGIGKECRRVAIRELNQ